MRRPLRQLLSYRLTRARRHSPCLLLACLVAAPTPWAGESSSATLPAPQPKPLSFEFVHEPPGKLISVGRHRLHVLCVGDGPVSVLLESGLGGTSLEWRTVQDALARRTRVCAYDRGGYAWSDPAGEPRDANRLAREADLMLNNLSIRGPLIVVGHSFGGFIVRRLAYLRYRDIVGMVLVDASHEHQIARYEQLGGKAMLPRRGTFVIGAMSAPEKLPPAIRAKVVAFGRMRKTYAAVHGEMKYFRHSATQVGALPRPVKYPVIVMRRGRHPVPQDDMRRRKESIWQELQSDLASISDQSEIVIAKKSGHYIHVDQPELLIRAIGRLLDHHDKASI